MVYSYACEILLGLYLYDAALKKIITRTLFLTDSSFQMVFFTLNSPVNGFCAYIRFIFLHKQLLQVLKLHFGVLPGIVVVINSVRNILVSQIYNRASTVMKLQGNG